MSESKETLHPTMQCKCLRSKEMYYSSPCSMHELEDCGAYWCLSTYEAVGPDRGAATPEECGPSRSCFKS